MLSKSCSNFDAFKKFLKLIDDDNGESKDFQGVFQANAKEQSCRTSCCFGAGSMWVQRYHAEENVFKSKFIAEAVRYYLEQLIVDINTRCAPVDVTEKEEQLIASAMTRLISVIKLKLVDEFTAPRSAGEYPNFIDKATRFPLDV